MKLKKEVVVAKEKKLKLKKFHIGKNQLLMPIKNKLLKIMKCNKMIKSSSKTRISEINQLNILIWEKIQKEIG